MRHVDWKEISRLLRERGVRRFYHFTDRSNLAGIDEEGGLYAWHILDERAMDVPCPGGDPLSHRVDARLGLDRYIHLSLSPDPPSLQRAVRSGRIVNPVILEVSLDVAFEEGTRFCIGNPQISPDGLVGPISSVSGMAFASSIGEADLSEAEILVEGFIDANRIWNLYDEIDKSVQEARNRENPRSLIFMVNQTIMMGQRTFMGDTVCEDASEAVADTVCLQIREALRIWEAKHTDTQLDIAILGYGDRCESAWGKIFHGLGFVSSSQLLNSMAAYNLGLDSPDNEFLRFAKDTWFYPEKNYWKLDIDAAYDAALRLSAEWMDAHGNECLPPCIINFSTAEEYSKPLQYSNMVSRAESLLSLRTAAGQSMVMNIHVSPFPRAQVFLPGPSESRGIEKDSQYLYDYSSEIPDFLRGKVTEVYGIDGSRRRHLMAVNAPQEKLVQLIGVLI